MGFCKFKLENGLICNREFKNTGNTTTLNRHLKDDHKCNDIKASIRKTFEFDDETHEFETLILKLIISAALPYYILKNRYFKEIINKYTAFSSPSSYTIQMRQDELYEKKLLEIGEIISKVTNFAFTNDGWTSAHMKKSFISLKIHFLNKFWKHCSLDLGVYAMPGSHTAKRISER